MAQTPRQMEPNRSTAPRTRSPDTETARSPTPESTTPAAACPPHPGSVGKFDEDRRSHSQLPWQLPAQARPSSGGEGWNIGRFAHMDPRILKELRYADLRTTLQGRLPGGDDPDLSPARIRWEAHASISLDGLEELHADYLDALAALESAGADAPRGDRVVREALPSALTGCALGYRMVDGAPVLDIFKAHGIKLDLYGAELVDVLDADSAEAAEFLELFDIGRGQLRHDVEEKLAEPPSELLIIKEARVAPAWRGLGGVGRLLAGRFVQIIAPGALVALKPFPVDVRRDSEGKADPADFDRLLPGVRRAWAGLGFEPCGDELMILDLGLVHFSNALTALTSKFGL